MKNIYTVSQTLAHAEKLVRRLQHRGFHPTTECVMEPRFGILIDVTKNTYLVVYQTEVELVHKTQTDSDYELFRRFFTKEDFLPSQIIHAIIDLTK